MKIKELYAKYKYYVICLIIGFIAALFFLPNTIKEVRSEQDIKTIENLKSEVKSATSKLLLYKDYFKSNCYTEYYPTGKKKSVRCQREGGSQSNAQTQSSSEGLTTYNNSTNSHSSQYSLTKPANTIGLGAGAVWSKNTLAPGIGISGQIWRLEPVAGFYYDVKNSTPLVNLMILVH